MSKLKEKVLNLLRKYWFFLVIGIIVIIFIFNREIAIWTTICLLFIFMIYYIPTLSLKKKIIHQITSQNRLTDSELSEKFKRSLEEIRDKMFVLWKNQKKKKWLIVLLNKRYISFNENSIEKFTELYYKGFTEKQIHEELKEFILIRSRAEIKAIEKTLIGQNRLMERKYLGKSTSNQNYN